MTTVLNGWVLLPLQAWVGITWPRSGSSGSRGSG